MESPATFSLLDSTTFRGALEAAEDVLVVVLGVWVGNVIFGKDPSGKPCEFALLIVKIEQNVKRINRFFLVDVKKEKLCIFLQKRITNSFFNILNLSLYD
jgi:hypothetical protein